MSLTVQRVDAPVSVSTTGCAFKVARQFVETLGVRVVGMMHYADNAFGTICMGWDGELGGTDVARGRRLDLTGLGKELVSELESRTMLIDLAHADTATIQDVCMRARRPVLC